MTAPERSIFREQALKKYLNRQNQGILLRLASPPTFIFCWILLLLLLAAGALAWWTHVPVYMSGEGVLVQPQLADMGGDQAVAILFVQPTQLTSLRVGQSVNLSIGSSATGANGTITRINTTLISPADARRQFNLQGSLAQLVSSPSATIIITLNAPVSAKLYAGSLYTASVQIGSRSVLSLLPGFDRFIH